MEQALKQSFPLDIEMMGIEAVKRLVADPSARPYGALVYLNSNGFEHQFMYESARFNRLKHISNLADQYPLFSAFVQSHFATNRVPRYLLLLPQHLRGDAPFLPIYTEYVQIYDYLRFLESPRLSGSNMGHFCHYSSQAGDENDQSNLCFIVSGKDSSESSQTLQRLLSADLQSKLKDPAAKIEKVDRVVVGVVDEEEQIYYRELLKRVDPQRRLGTGTNSIVAYFGDSKRAVVYDPSTNLQDFIDGCLLLEPPGSEFFVSDEFAHVEDRKSVV